MVEEAFRWWNGIVNDEEDNPNPPGILPPDDASLLVPLISPILHNHTNYTMEDANCWDLIHKSLCKLANNPNIENPNDDFPEFVVQLYSYKKLLKINDIETAMIYIDKFCPNTPNDFFIRDLALSIDNPELCVLVLLKLINDKDERFFQCLNTQGFTDRIFDLYIPFLLLFNLQDEHFKFRLDVSTLLVNVLEINSGQLKDHMFTSIYQKLLTLITYAPMDIAYSLFRNVMKINDLSLNNLNREQQQNRLKNLIGIADSKCPIRFAIIHYVAKFNNIFDLYDIIKYISKKLPVSTTDIEIPIQLVKELNNESPMTHLMVVRNLCRTLMQSNVFMRAAASLLIEFLSNYESDEIIDWMRAFVRRIFIFFKICVLKNKYLNRVLNLCSVLSSSIFQSIPWLWKSLQLDASEAYRDHLSFIADYFPITSETDEIFQKEISIFSATKISLKVFPFKADTCTLTENHQTRQYSNYKAMNTDSHLDELGIPLNIARYLYYDSEITTSEQKTCQFQLEDLIEEQRGKMIECEKAHLSTKYPKMNKFQSAGKMIMVGASIAYKESENAVWEFQKRSINEFIRTLNEIHKLLGMHQNIMANIKLLIFDNNAVVTDSVKYKSLKDRRHACKKNLLNLATKYRSPNYEQMILDELTNSLFKYDLSISYSPPSQIDSYINEYLLRSEKFSPMVEAAAAIVTMGSVDAAKTTIEELAMAISESINRATDGSNLVISQAILRSIFDICYSSSSIINGYKSANTEFIRKCDEFAAKTVMEASIPDCIVGSLRRRATVSTMFRNKKLMSFSNIEYMTNPLDMVRHIHAVITSLDSLNYRCQARHESVILIQCVISVSPPCNTVSTIKFIEQWATPFLSKGLNDSLSIYKEAINRIMNVDAIDEDT